MLVCTYYLTQSGPQYMFIKKKDNKWCEEMQPVEIKKMLSVPSFMHLGLV